MSTGIEGVQAWRGASLGVMFDSFGECTPNVLLTYFQQLWTTRPRVS
jgi:hypothetical protein